jgi:hypothetical protein
LIALQFAVELVLGFWPGIIAAILAAFRKWQTAGILCLIQAVYFFYFGITMTNCTQGSTDSLLVTLIFSPLFLLLGWAALAVPKRSWADAVLGLAACGGFLFQAYWSFLIMKATTFGGQNPCGVYNERGFLEYAASDLDRWYGPLFFAAAVISIGLLLRLVAATGRRYFASAS